MSNEVQSDLSVAPAQSAVTGIGRRRLLRAGLAATPVVLAVSGRSAMAGAGDTCAKGLSPMAWNSLTSNGTKTCVQTSHTVQGNSSGLSPGYWCPNGNGKIDQNAKWPAPRCIPFDSYYSGCSTSTTTDWSTGTKFNTFFVGSSETRSISVVLMENSNTNANRHLCAALLNALVYPDYAMTVAEVQELATGKLGAQTGLTVSEIKAYLDQTWWV